MSTSRAFDISGGTCGQLGQRDNYEANNEYYRRVIQGDLNGLDSIIASPSSGSIRSESTLNEQFYQDSTSEYATRPPRSPLSLQSIESRLFPSDSKYEKGRNWNDSDRKLYENRPRITKVNYEAKKSRNLDPTDEEYSLESDRRLIGKLRREEERQNQHHHLYRRQQPEKQQQRQQQHQQQQQHHQQQQQYDSQQHDHNSNFQYLDEKSLTMIEKENRKSNVESIQKEKEMFISPQSFHAKYHDKNSEIIIEKNSDAPPLIDKNLIEENIMKNDLIKSAEKSKQINNVGESLKRFLANATVNLISIVDFLHGIEGHVEEEADLDPKVRIFTFCFIFCIFLLFVFVFFFFIFAALFPVDIFSEVYFHF